MSVRRHNPHGFDPVEHNAIIQAIIQERKARQRGELPRQRGIDIGVHLDDEAAITDLRDEKYLTALAEVTRYASDSGMDVEDFDYLLGRAQARARESGSVIDWAWIRDRIDGAYILGALR